jgi:hypothetical protein
MGTVMLSAKVDSNKIKAIKKMKSFSETKLEMSVLTTYQTEARDCEIYKAYGEKAAKDPSR